MAWVLLKVIWEQYENIMQYEMFKDMPLRLSMAEAKSPCYPKSGAITRLSSQAVGWLAVRESEPPDFFSGGSIL
jgi:hypothetical protein